MQQILLSKQMSDKIKELSETKNIDLFGYKIPVFESPLFPFEIHYDACDIETRQLVKIGSGELIHGAILPKIDFEIEPPSFEFSFDEHKSHMKAYMEQRWSMELFKNNTPR